MESLWEQTWKQPNFPAQDGDMDTDVLIIGGGIAGVLCALSATLCRSALYIGGSRNNMQRHHQKHYRQDYLSARANL